MIAVVFALAFERSGFETPPPGCDLWVLNCAGRPAEKTFRLHLETRAKPGLVVLAGLGGALDPGLQVGDLVVDARDATLPGLRLETWKPAKMTTTPVIVPTPLEKQALHEQGAGDVCEMESAFVRRLCTSAEIPFLSLRSISDAASTNLPVPPHVLLDHSTGRPAPQRLALYLLTHPTKIPPFVKMLQHATTARKALHRGLTVALQDLLRTGCFHRDPLNFKI